MAGLLIGIDGANNATVTGTQTLTNKTLDATTTTFPAGHVLQVVNVIVTTRQSQTIANTDTVVNSLTKDVTPKGTNSDFLLTARWFGESDSSWDLLFNFQMDGTRVNMVTTEGYGLGIGGNASDRTNDDSTPESSNFSTLVSTSSVIGTDITFRLVARDGDTGQTVWMNRVFGTLASNYEASTSELIITEIAG